MWIIFAFGSALFAGITSILAKCGMSQTDSSVATGFRTIVVLLFSWVMVFVTGVPLNETVLSSKNIVFLILSGMATGASWLCYFKALQIGDVNKVTPIDKSSTILTMILAILFLREEITICKVSAIVLIGLGTYFMIEKKEEIKEKQIKKQWIVYALLSAVFASLTSILGKVGVEQVDATLATAIRTIVVLIMAWIVVFVTNKQKEVKKLNKKDGIFLLLSGASTGASWLCYYHALQTGQASIVVPIDKFSIVVTIIFSYVVLKESITKKALIGLVMIVLGTLCLLI